MMVFERFVRPFIALPFLCTIHLSVAAQAVPTGKPTLLELAAIVPVHDGNVVNTKLAGDSLSTSFHQSIRDSVPLHYHAWHSEHIYVLAGTGSFTLGTALMDIAPGMYIFIPKGTPHAVRVTSPEPLRVLSVQTPHFDGSDRIPVR